MRNHPFERAVSAISAVQQRLQLPRPQPRYGRMEIQPQHISRMPQHLLAVTLFERAAVVHGQPPIVQRQFRLGHEQITVKIKRPAHAIASDARAMAAVKRKESRIQIGKAQMASGTEEFEAVQMFRVLRRQDRARALAKR
jgi:hypothetical protein